MRRVGFAVMTALVAASPLAAQGKGIDKGTFEIGAFARYNKFPSSVFEVTDAKSDRWGFGGRIGYFVARNLAIEVDGSTNPADLLPNQPGIPKTFNATSRPLLYTPFHLQLVYNAPLSNRFQWMFGAGASYNKFTKAIDESHVGFGGMTGIRWRALRALSFRLEATADIIPKGILDKSNTFLGAQLGLSLTPGGHACNHAMDAISIAPNSASLHPGDTQKFTATATYCGNTDWVVYRLTGPGTLDSTSGMYTATTAGSAQVTAYSRAGKMTSSASITVAEMAPVAPPPPAPVAPAPPPPPPPTAPVAQRYTFDLAMVHFRFDHADLTKGGQDSVRAIAEVLKAHADVNVDVIGHTDWIGTEAYNMKLSRARAETVRRLLVTSGVADTRITVKWRGKDEPIADNHTKDGRAMNRRAEVKQNN